MKEIREGQVQKCWKFGSLDMEWPVCCFLTRQCWLEIFLYCTFNDIPSWCILSN